MNISKKTQRTVLAVAVAALGMGNALAEGPTVSGFIDFGYVYNMNGLSANTYRAFDGSANSFTLQNAEVVLQGKSSSDVAYRVDVDYGQDGGVVNTFDGSGDDQIDLQQAYISMTCPLTKGTLTLGKFVTPFGAEVIEAKDNFNYSRGLLFTNAIPLVHTGVKLDKGLFDGKLALTGGLVNAWDASVDTNKGKTFLAQAGFTGIPKVSVIVGGAYGPETTSPAFSVASSTGTEKLSRSLVDVILKYTPTSKLTLLANADWGVEEGAGFQPTATDDVTANWAGVALYANYAFTDTWAGTLRYENFDDEGSRLTGGATHQTINSITGTLQYKMKDVITRLEYRTDQSTDKVYTKKDGTLDDTESTIGLEVIYSF
ncbi:MAG: porin [Elusimicrobia bacterium]|nr:porin [Elusimicrobiota bacterium]